MEQKAEPNKDFYDKWAINYDTDENSTVFTDELNFFKFWSHRTNQKVLEIGCGSGRNTQKLAAMNCQITANDISPKMIEIAKDKCSKYNVNFICDDFINIKLAKSEFDFAITSLVLEHIENLQSIFEKTYSHLKPGGIFYISEIHPVRMQNGSGARFFDETQNKEIRAQSFAHKKEDFETAAINCGFQMRQKSVFYGTEELLKTNKAWSKYLSRPMILVYEFYKPE
jgi:2-polyprenyl-3-methyl-5-hydroxy-6-metoxy-1,4-benzoquinol methylase